MYTETKIEERLEALMDQALDGDPEAFRYVYSPFAFIEYVQDVLSQIGLGYCGFVCRRRDGMVLMSVKVTEGGVPLVGYITSATTRGCMDQFLRSLKNSRVTWHKDRYPWI